VVEGVSCVTESVAGVQRRLVLEDRVLLHVVRNLAGNGLLHVASRARILAGNVLRDGVRAARLHGEAVFGGELGHLPDGGDDDVVLEVRLDPLKSENLAGK
jgi:hypothetical protein